MAARNIFMDENELCKVGDFGLLRETTTYDDEDEEKHYVMRVSDQAHTSVCILIFHCHHL